MSARTFDDVFAGLARLVGDALRVDPATLTPETNLIYDLNAESIDLVDIRFRIEETFGFHIEQREFIAAMAAGNPGDVGSQLTLRRLTEFVLMRTEKTA